MNNDKFGFDIISQQALDAIVENSDLSYSTNVASGSTLVLPDIKVTDSNGSLLTIPSVQDFSCTPIPVGATLLKTGQTVSIASYDDGATQRGRLTNFNQLSGLNPFGIDNKRFTDKTGIGIFTNKVAYDWNTYNGSTVLAYYFGDMGTARPWATQLSQYVNSTIDGLTGWYLTNFQEMVNIMNFSLMGSYQLNYSPFNTTQRYFWVSTQIAGSNGVATDLAGINPFTSSNKTSALYGIWVRVCNVSVSGGVVTIT